MEIASIFNSPSLSQVSQQAINLAQNELYFAVDVGL